MSEHAPPRWIVLRGQPDHEGTMLSWMGETISTDAVDAWYHESQPLAPLGKDHPVRRLDEIHSFKATGEFEQIGDKKCEVFRFVKATAKHT